MYLQLVTHINSNLKNYQFYKNFKDKLKKFVFKVFLLYNLFKTYFFKINN